MIAGKVDATITKVGVDNGIATFKGTHNVTSQYSLIGKTTSDTEWPDSHTATSGGDLKVTPSIYTSVDENNHTVTHDTLSSFFTGSQDSLASSSVEVPESAPGRAKIYQTSYLKSGSDADISYLKYYNTRTSFAGDFTNGVKQVGSTSGTTDYTNTYSATTDTEAADRYKNEYLNKITTRKVIKFNNVVSFSGSNISNCVWFKPESPGICAMAFGHFASKYVDYMSLYRFKRNANNTINTSTKQEIQFIVNNDLKNKTAAYFECELTADDVGDWEYAIGQSSGHANSDTKNGPGFYYMLLGGSDTGGGSAPDGTGKIIDRVEFIYDVFTFKDGTAFGDGYVFDRTVIMYTSTATTAGSQHFAEFADGYVNYTNNICNLTVTEMVGVRYKSVVNNTGPYTPRSNTPPSTT